MTQPERVTSNDLRRVAELANLELTPGEESSMLRDLNSILDHVAELNKLDTSTIPAMSQVSEVLSSQSSSSWPLRLDEIVPSLDRSRVMTCAPDADETYFRVPKVIER